MDDKPYFRCFCCGLQLAPVIPPHPEGDDRTTPIDNGTHWRTSGNFGSTIHDGPEGDEIEIVICDWCVMERADRARVYLRDGSIKSADFSGVRGPGARPQQGVS